MVKCPSCGRKTDGDYCQWCGSPILRGGLGGRRRTERTKKDAEEVEKRAKKEAEQLAREQAKKEAEAEKKAREAEARAKKDAEEAEKRASKEAEQLAREQAKKEAEEEKKAREAEARAKKDAEEAEKGASKEAEQLAREQVKKEAEAEKKAREAEEAEKRASKEAVRDIGSATYEGDFQLVLPSPVGFKQVRQFTERLEEVEDLKIVWTGGSMDEGAIIAVSVQKSVPLVRILKEMPVVEKVDMKDEKIVVMLKTSA